MSVEPARLYSALLNSGLQQKDPALYQVINQLIGLMISLANQIDTLTANSSSGSSSTTNITNNIINQLLDGGESNNSEDSLIPGPIGLPGKDNSNNLPVFLSNENDNSDIIIVPGPKGDIGPVGLSNNNSPVFISNENNENDDILVIPGPKGNDGNVGSPGIPGFLLNDEVRETEVIAFLTLLIAAITGSGTTGNLAKWASGTSLTDGPAASNVPLLNAANIFTAAQAISVANGVSSALSARFNSSNPLMGLIIANSNGFVYLGYNTVSQVSSDIPKYDINGFAAQLRLDNGAFHFSNAPSGTAGAVITLTERWGININGDWTFGASVHIADSSGVPTIASGFGSSPSIVGNDYAFAITIGSISSSGIVNFGHTFTNPPIVVVSANTGITLSITSISTTQVQITYSAVTTGIIYVLVRGY